MVQNLCHAHGGKLRLGRRGLALYDESGCQGQAQILPFQPKPLGFRILFFPSAMAWFRQSNYTDFPQT